VDADTTLTADARERLERATPASTRRAYDGDFRRFVDWCASVGATAMPATAETLVNYTSHLASVGRAPNTIDRALSSIAVAHDAAGVPKPSSKAARRLLRGYRRDRATEGTGVRKATPVTVTALRAMVGTLELTTPAGLRDRALLVLGFALGARRSELAGLDLGDLTLKAEGIEVLIRVSKTDKDSAGRTVAIPYGTHLDTCPVRTVLAWRDHLADAGRTSGPLFVRIDRHGVLGRASSGRGAEDGRLTGQAVAIVVDRAARRGGLDPAALWSGHSLRRGLATESHRAGAPKLAIARHGGWAPNSAALDGYIEEVDRWTDNPLRKVGL